MAAEDTITVDDVVYRLNSDGTAAVKSVESVQLYIDIPETVTCSDGQSYTVATVGSNSFYRCSSTLTITLPETVTSIGEQAFQNCYDLQSVNIPSGVTELPDRVFEFCYDLSDVTLPSGLVSIGDYAFSNCSSLTSITLPNGLESLGMGAFESTGLTAVTIPESITSFGGYEFSGTKLETVTVPGNMKALHGSFKSCSKLRTVVLEEGVEQVEGSAFLNCRALTTITFSSTVKSIGQFAFENTDKLSQVNLAEGLETIGNLAFCECPSLTSITIPASVTTISKAAFDYVDMDYVILKGTTPPQVSQNSFPLETPLYVPAQAVEAYRADKNFSVYDIRSMDDPLPGNGQRSISASPKRLDFGTLEDGYGTNVPEAQFITVTNTGDEEVTVLNPDGDMADFYVPGGHGVGSENRLASGESLDLPFRPSFARKPGTYTEQVTIRTKEGPTAAVELTFTVARKEGAVSLVASTTEMDFGTRTQGYSQPSSRKVAITNTSDGTLTLKTPASTRSFEVVSFSPTTIADGEKAYLEVRPKTGLSGGSYSETITVESTSGASVAVTLKFAVEAVEDQPASPIPFTDVPAGAWYEAAVKYVYEQGIMSGASGTSFAPDMKLSRAQVAQVLYNMEGSPAVTAGGAFTDVAGNAWYAKAVNWASEQGIVSGYGGGRFGPEDNVTREQLALILFNYAGYKKYDTTARRDLSSFVDEAKVSGWAGDAMKWAVGAGLLSGKTGGLLDPGGTAARSEAAKLLMSFCQGVAGQ